MSYILALFKASKHQSKKSKLRQKQKLFNDKENIAVVVNPPLPKQPKAEKVLDRKSISVQPHGKAQELEYHEEITESMRRNESKYMPKEDFMSTVQKDISWDMRRVLVDWLIEVQKEYRMATETLYLAVNYVDRILSIHSVHRSKLQLVGASCLMIASKYVEIHPPSLEEYVYICDDAYTSVQMRSMESFVLDSLNFCLTVTTTFDFLNVFVKDVSPSTKQRSFSFYLAEIALGESLHTKCVPSKIAAACLFLSGLHLSSQQWEHLLDGICGYKYEEIESVVQELHVIFVQRHASKANAVHVKYSSPKFHRVSEITPRHTDLNQLIIREKKRLASNCLYERAA